MSSRAISVLFSLLAWTALVVATPAAADPAPSPIPNSQKQKVFIDYLNKQQVPFTTPKEAVALARTTCANLGTDSPTRLQDTVNALKSSTDMSTEQMQVFASAAIRVYCPGVKV